MRKWLDGTRELAWEERELKASLPGHCSRVLRGKRLLVFKEMLEECGHGDESLVDVLFQGLG